MPSRKKAKGKERKAKKEDTGKKVKPGELLANLPGASVDMAVIQHLSQRITFAGDLLGNLKSN